MATQKPNTDGGAPLERLSSISPTVKAGRNMYLSEGDGISPLMLGKEKYIDDFDLDSQVKQSPNRPAARKRLSRQTFVSASPSWGRLAIDGSGTLPSRSSVADTETKSQASKPQVNAILDEIAAWVQEEREKKHGRRAKRKLRRGLHKVRHPHSHDHESGPEDASINNRCGSSSSEGSDIDLGKLESILERGMRSSVDLNGNGVLAAQMSSLSLRRVGSKSQRHFRRASTLKPAGMDGQDEEVFVPDCDAIIDNSKTIGYTLGYEEQAAEDADESEESTRSPWQQFKHEILRVTHTLKLKRWRHIPMSMSGEISVERLSGALTNAVYVVAPPHNWVHKRAGEEAPGRAPLKLLLRIYGAQTGELIDRPAELKILGRLAKKNIGPRLLGTFTNGRFEEFLHAKALNFEDLRQPDVSRQIAKRMRELHDGIELLDEERDTGPFVWKNWDKCVERAERIMSFVDPQTSSGRRLSTSASTKTAMSGAYVCGTPWTMFRETVERYRKLIEREYGGLDKLNDQMVFAHNDTQYGNILRVDPPGESPLLHPANVHKQLVVIDFEYANANVPGLEFANHFTEWCYNYHDPKKSYACNTSHYPTLEEQIRFLRAYVSHQPQHNPAAPSTPRFTPLHPTGSFSSLDLDKLQSRSDETRGTATSYSNETVVQRQAQKAQAETDAATHDEVRRLLRETHLWRITNSAQWVVWGIMQAEIPGMPREIKEQNDADAKGEEVPYSDPLDAEDKAAKEDVADKRPDADEEEESGEFDYLAYARDRAMFFWGDCLQMGLVSEDELGKELTAAAKIVPY